ncbi:GHMP kinase [Candidatus Woesearchaeota archaeon]|nr:GHMP kinase [Candidatus Woesearchaeota archaeon]
MIITKTPFRISFAGGGTDLAAFYTREYGAVVSTAIDKYVYIALHKHFENKIQLKYSKTELVDKIDDIEHPLIRECMRLTNHKGSLEMTSFADIPSKGSGLGSSSAFSVGLIKALKAFNGEQTSAEECAHGACTVEIEKLGAPIGPQDQYAAAYGGFNYIKFNPDHTVTVEPILLSREQKKIIQNHLMMFYLGNTRSSNNILSEQSKNTTNDIDKFNNLVKMRDLANEMCDRLNKGDIKCFGEILHKGWMFKRELASGISSQRIDEYYEAARSAGAVGGKVLGAGGGGFMLFWVPPNKQVAVTDALSELDPFPMDFDHQGSRIIHYDD